MTIYWIWLTSRAGLGPVRIYRLLELFGGAKQIYDASEEELTRMGVPVTQRRALAEKDLTAAQAVLNACRAEQIRILCWKDPDYPEPLRLTENAPPLLYCRGTLPPSGRRPWIGVVGAREADSQGLAIARRLSWQISGCGGLVVTGMAKGVDAEAACAALEQGGSVVGVLGAGVDVVYPKENQELFERVQAQGCLLSEYPPGTPPYAGHFPARNRIISALSDGVLVVQATEKSGALITARLAVEQGRDLFSVPGPAGERLSRGCNQLLRDGAILAECGWDVMQEYSFRYPETVREYQGLPPELEPLPAAAEPKRPAPSGAKGAKRFGGTGSAKEAKRPGGTSSAALSKPRPAPTLEELSPVQQALVQALQDGPLQLDKLINRTGLSASAVLAELTMLQIKNLVQQKPGKVYELL